MDPGSDQGSFNSRGRQINLHLSLERDGDLHFEAQGSLRICGLSPRFLHSGSEPSGSVTPVPSSGSLELPLLPLDLPLNPLYLLRNSLDYSLDLPLTSLDLPLDTWIFLRTPWICLWTFTLFITLCVAAFAENALVTPQQRAVAETTL